MSPSNEGSDVKNTKQLNWIILTLTLLGLTACGGGGGSSSTSSGSSWDTMTWDQGTWG